MEYIKPIGLYVDTSSLAEKLIEHPEYFDINKNRTIVGSPHEHSSDIWVRFGDVDRYGYSIFVEEHDSVWYPLAEMLPEAIDIAMKVMAKVKGERLGGVLITKLEPTKEILSHKDLNGWHPEYYDKFFVPIKSDKGSKFCFDDGELESNAGDVHWFRNDVSHWVVNGSDDVRLTMVVCIKPLNKEFLNV